MVVNYNEILFNNILAYLRVAGDINEDVSTDMTRIDADLGIESRFNSGSGLFKPFLQLTGFMADPVQFMQDLFTTGHKIQRVRLGIKHFVFVSDPDAAQEILVRRSHIYIQNRTVFDRIKPVTGKRGLVQLSGHESKKARIQSRPLFTSAGLQEAEQTIQFYAKDFIGRLTGASSFDVTDEMTKLILRTALKIFLDVDSEDLVNEIGGRFLRLNSLSRDSYALFDSNSAHYSHL